MNIINKPKLATFSTIMPAKRSSKKALPANLPLRRSTRPRKVVSTKGTCGAPAARVALGGTVPATQTTVVTSGAYAAVPIPAKHSSIRFREEVGLVGYVEVTIRGKAMDNETVRIAQILAQHHFLLSLSGVLGVAMVALYIPVGNVRTEPSAKNVWTSTMAILRHSSVQSAS